MARQPPGLPDRFLRTRTLLFTHVIIIIIIIDILKWPKQ